MKRIFCLYTGGTIGCVDSPNGLIPQHGILPKLISDLACSHIPSIEVTLHEYAQALDSAAMTPTHWRHIACDIAERVKHYDGFVVLHGTDTMAWTGAALHWQLENIHKPVILTGAQRPWIHAGSDAPANMQLALETAASDITGVHVAFGGLVLPAHCVKKLDADHDTAYGAPNAAHTNAMPTDQFALRAINPALNILALKLYPGCENAIASMIQTQTWDGMVIESYGSGNLPSHDGLTQALNEQAQRGAIIINCTQCIAGEVRQGLYATGDVFNTLGAWPAGRRTVEAARTWLYTHLGRSDKEVLRQAWQSVASL
ncbi:asparaginase [Chitinibacter bivalviorum]|uniref:Asparaginase n=1 Tax=Chitinibacter bivalviorum TaxID=2739434 RepID=A0A7H9BIC9_9NEIS|nr:asparaginase [Chitinibacter bivalviorum]QLG88385.1 asparaginase [Chitinibacter bivalviorum]